jgi:hypothetical protein
MTTDTQHKTHQPKAHTFWCSIFRGVLFSAWCAVMLTSTATTFAQGQEPRQYQRWGQFGVGKLVTMVSNLNCVADGQMRWPALAHLPALEYPFNPDPQGRHIHYGTGVSFYVGGYSEDLGPSFNPLTSDAPTTWPRVESGDRTYYRFYDGFHYDGFPAYINSRLDGSVPLSNDRTTWPSAGFPDSLPRSDWYHASRFPNYRNVYQNNFSIQPPRLKKDSTGWPGSGPNGERKGDQEFFAVNFSVSREQVETPDIQNGKLMVYTTMHGLSFAEEFYDDALFFSYRVTNVGNQPIRRTYLGLMADFDFPWASYQRYDSYNRVDNYAYDSTLQMVYGWDGDGNIEGASPLGSWSRNVRPLLVDGTSPERVALGGVMFLKTPKVRTNNIVSPNREYGLRTWDAFYLRSKNTTVGMGSTSWRYYWNNIANRDPDGEGPSNAYDPDDLNRDGKDDWTWERPFPAGSEEQYSSGYKCEFMMSAGDSTFTLRPGETDTLIVAIVMGDSRDQLLENARFAKLLYESNFNPIRPPLEPTVRAYSTDGTIKLVWGNRSENRALNQANSRETFQGYRLFRSTDGGVTWGDKFITNSRGDRVDFSPVKQWDLKDTIAGPSRINPTFNLGSNTGLEEIMEVVARDTTIFERSATGDTLFFGNFRAGDTTGRRIWTDRNVVNGIRYLYAVTAYSPGNEFLRIPPVQNGRIVTTKVPHVVSATPVAPAALSSADLEKIKVVPNPYRGTSLFENSQNSGEVRFTRLPKKCTIKIFNVAGELVQQITHDEAVRTLTDEPWNLRTRENRDAAPGLYFFVVESDLGKKQGKFVIIR